MTIHHVKLSLKVNHSARTYTIRKYIDGKYVAKYRSYPQAKSEFSEHWTERDIKYYLDNTDDYYEVKQ